MADAANGGAAVDAGAAAAAPEAAAFEEIWRPGKRKDSRKAHADQVKQRAKPRQREREAQAPRQREPRARLERKERPRPSDSSPFAVLAELRRNLAARRPEGN